jgi:hypothetical protein
MFLLGSREIWCDIIRLGPVGDKGSLLTVNASLVFREWMRHPPTDEVLEKAAEKATPFLAAVKYHFTDARFSAWGRASKVLVPELAEKLATKLNAAGWAKTDYDLAKGLAVCNPFK